MDRGFRWNSDGEQEDVPLRTQQLSRLSTALIAVVVIGVGSACSNDSAPGSTGAIQDTTETGQDPRAEEAKKAALAAYAGYLAASREAELAANPHDPQLAKFLADPLLTRVRLTIRDAKEHGAMRTGKLISDPTVTAVSLDTEPATVSIQDCLDATNYRLVYVKDKSVVPGSTVGRYLATATATRYPDGRWLISAGAAHQDQPC